MRERAITQSAGRPGTWAVDGSRLWRGVVPAALVGAGVAIVGLIVIRELLDVPVLRRSDGKAVVEASTLWYVVAAAIAAVGATALIHVLLRLSPRPFAFYSWITGLVIAVVTLVPLTFSASRETRVATAVLNLAIGAIVAVLVAGVGRTVSSQPPRRARTP
jgi:hypothetical protein